MELKETRELNYTVIFEPAEEGGYTAVVPALPGCVSEGNSLEETRRNIREAMEGYLETLVAHGGTIPDDITAEPLCEKISVAL